MDKVKTNRTNTSDKTNGINNINSKLQCGPVPVLHSILKCINANVNKEKWPNDQVYIK